MNPIDQAVILEEAKRYSDSKGGGACLPVVELSGAETLTTEEQAQLTACAEKRMPVVVKVVQDGMTVYAALVGYMFNGEDREYHTFAGDIGVFTSTKDGVWKAQWA